MRDRLVIVSLMAGCCFVVANELLSLGRLLSFWPILLLWVLGSVFAIVFLRKNETQPGIGLRIRIGEWSTFEQFMAGIIGCLLLISLFSGLLTPPASFDVMTYHLPRQIHWLQQQTVEHFPAHLLHQLHREPLAEFLGLHLLILTGTDLLVSLVSWASLVLSLILVSLVARELGANRRGQLFAMLTGAAIPIAFLQASTAKNDLVAIPWLLSIVYLALRTDRQRCCGQRTSSLLGIAFGLAVLSKGAVYILAFPLVILVGALILRFETKRAWRHFLIMAGFFVLINAGHYSRNYRLFGSPFIPAKARAVHVNETWELRHLASRLIREVSLDLGTPISPLNSAFELIIRRVHANLGVDLQDSATTVPERPFGVYYVPGNEYHASAPAHLFLGVILPIAALALRKRILGPGFWLLLPLPYASYAGIVLVLKWSTFLLPRLHLFSFFLIAALTARLLSTKGISWLTPYLSLLLILALVPVIKQSPRSLLGPAFQDQNQLLFSAAPRFRRKFERAAALINSLKPASVGLDSRGCWQFEYPMMRLLRRDFASPRFQAFNVTNVSSRLYPTDYRSPEIVVAYSPVERVRDQQTGVEFIQIGQFEDVSVLARAEVQALALPVPLDLPQDALF